MSFSEDLKAGEDIEQEILLIIQKAFPNARKETGKFHREFYDIVIPKSSKKQEIKLEIKADLYKSNNLAFECLGRKGKSTGILKTSAHAWVHFRNGKYLVWEITRLKKYLLNHGCGFIRECGDQKASCAWIIPEETILKDCPPDLITNRKTEEINKFLSKIS